MLRIPMLYYVKHNILTRVCWSQQRVLLLFYISLTFCCMRFDTFCTKIVTSTAFMITCHAVSQVFIFYYSWNTCSTRSSSTSSEAMLLYPSPSPSSANWSYILLPLSDMRSYFVIVAGPLLCFSQCCLCLHCGKQLHQYHRFYFCQWEAVVSLAPV